MLNVARLFLLVRGASCGLAESMWGHIDFFQGFARIVRGFRRNNEITAKKKYRLKNLCRVLVCSFFSSLSFSLLLFFFYNDTVGGGCRTEQTRTKGREKKGEKNIQTTTMRN